MHQRPHFALFTRRTLAAAAAICLLHAHLPIAQAAIADPARYQQIVGAGMNSLSDVVVARLKAER